MKKEISDIRKNVEFSMYEPLKIDSFNDVQRCICYESALQGLVDWLRDLHIIATMIITSYEFF